jgi:threonine aldolase
MADVFPRALTHHGPQSPHDTFAALAAATPEDLSFDRYGEAEWLADFESEVARELGKEAAAFMPSGTMAQQIALRIWCERRANSTIAFHPTSHLELHESRAYAFLHGLRALTVGPPAALMTAKDFETISEPVGALLLELPQREIGCRLPEWDDLLALVAAARRAGTPVHLDGARLWEAAPHYGRSHAEIAAPFDSVYVSFYKGLGALAGAMLAGDAGFVAQARTWQHRHGGRLVTIAPLALSARAAFAGNLSKMAGYRERARAIARGLSGVANVTIVPDPPHTNTFHLFLQGSREDLEQRALDYARETGTLAFARLAATAFADRWKWEFVAGEATMSFSVDDVVRAIRRIANA